MISLSVLGGIEERPRGHAAKYRRAFFIHNAACLALLTSGN
jgi:hypothetical protein